jgi:Ca-activated chloride channel family protein
MLSGKQKVTDSKVTAINPIVFGIKKSKAEALGFTGGQVSMGDILFAVRSKQLSFLMPSATQTNSGASAYLGFLSALAGSPEVLTQKALEEPGLREAVKELFSGVDRNSGSEDYVGELYLTGGYDAMINYEFLMIGLNQRLEREGKEPLYLIYPKEGVSLSDSPFAYIDHGDKAKKAEFVKLQSWLLGAEAQKAMAETGRRTGYGGQNPYGSEKVFRSEWGIDMRAYLTPIKYPAADVIREAFRIYQEDLKKPSVTVFCLDMSGSMYGEGYQELTEAMTRLLTPEVAAQDFIQFGEQDVILLIPFDGHPRDTIRGSGKDQQALLKALLRNEAGGYTDVYEALVEAYRELRAYDDKSRTLSVVLMTDGQSGGDLQQFARLYRATPLQIGVYSITFGLADTEQLEDIAKLTGGKVFNGKTDLTEAFQTVRGYN